MKLLFNFSYTNKYLNSSYKDCSFSREYYHLLAKFGFTDSWFIYCGQKIFTSILSPEFFDSQQSECFHKLGQDTIIFTFITKYDRNLRGQYAYYLDAVKSYDIVFLPFSWYTRDAIFNSDSAYIRAIDNGDYKIQSIGYTPLTWINESTDSSIYSNPLPVISYDSNGNFIAYKTRPNGLAFPNTFFQLSFPSVIDTLLIYVDFSTTVQCLAQIKYYDGVFENSCNYYLHPGLNEVYMFQDNPTNPRIYEVLPPSNLLRSLPNKNYYGYQLLDNWVKGNVTYNSDRTITFNDGTIKQHYGFYKVSIDRGFITNSAIFVITLDTYVNTKVIAYDELKNAVAEFDLTNFITNFNKLLINGGWSSASYLSLISPDPLPAIDLDVHVSGEQIALLYGSQYTLTDPFNGTLFYSLASFNDDGSNINIGAFTTNSHYFCFGLFNFSTQHIGDLSQYCSNFTSNISTTFNTQFYSYYVYFINSSHSNLLTENTSIPYYKKLSFKKNPIHVFSEDYDVLTNLVVIIESDSQPYYPQIQHYGFNKHALPTTSSMSGKYFLYKPTIPFNTVDNDVLLTWNTGNNVALQYHKNNSDLGHGSKYYFTNFYSSVVDQYKYISRTCTNALIDSTTDFVTTTESVESMKANNHGVFMMGQEAIPLYGNGTNCNYYANYRTWTCSRLDSYTDVGSVLTLPVAGAAPYDQASNGFWIVGADLQYPADNSDYCYKDCTFYHSNIHGKWWKTGISQNVVFNFYLFDQYEMTVPFTWSTSNTYYAKYSYSGLDNFDVDIPFTKPTRVIIIIERNLGNRKFVLDSVFSNMTLKSLLYPSRMYLFTRNNLWPTAPVVPWADGIFSNAVPACSPAWQSFGTSRLVFQYCAHIVNFLSTDAKFSFVLLSNTFKTTGVKNYRYYIQFYYQPLAQYSAPIPTPACDGSGWLQDGDIFQANSTYNTPTDIVIYISKSDKTMTLNLMKNDIELYAFVADTNITTTSVANINLNSISAINIGNELDGLVDTLNNPVIPGNLIINLPNPNKYLTDWAQEETMSIINLPNRLFTNTWNFNSNTYTVQQGVGSWSGEDTFNNQLNKSTAFKFANAGNQIFNLNFLLVSDLFESSRVQDYEYTLHYNDYFSAPPGVWYEYGTIFKDGEINNVNSINLDIVTFQIRKISSQITNADLSNLKFYIWTENIVQTIPQDMSGGILSIGNSYDTDKDSLNNPCKLGFPVKSIPNGNDHVGVYNQLVASSWRDLIVIFPYFNLYKESALIYNNNFEKIYTSNDGNYISLLYPDFNPAVTDISMSYTQQTDLVPGGGAVAVINNGNPYYKYQHWWGKKLYELDPTTNYGTTDPSTLFQIFNKTLIYNDNGSLLTIGASSLLSAKCLVMNLDVGQCDYTFFGSNLFCYIRNEQIDVNLKYSLYFINGKTSPIITFGTQVSYYKKLEWLPGQIMLVDEWFQIKPSRLILIIEKTDSTFIDYDALANDNIYVGTLPQIMFTNSNYTTSYSSNCYSIQTDTVGYFTGSKCLVPNYNASGAIRINGFANSIMNPNMGEQNAGYFFYSNTFNKFQYQYFQYGIITNNIDETLTNSYITDTVLVEPAGTYLPVSSLSPFANNLIYFDFNSTFNTFQDFDYFLSTGNLVIGAFEQVNEITTANLIDTHNSINIGNTSDGLYDKDLLPVTLDSLIIKPDVPPPPPGEDEWIIPSPQLISPGFVQLYFSNPPDAENWYLDVYISDPNDILHYNVLTINTRFTDENKMMINIVDTKPDITRAIGPPSRLPPNPIPAINAHPGSWIVVNGRLRCSRLDQLCNPQPTQMLIVPLNTLYNYTITLDNPCIDVIFGAKKPYAGQPILSDQGMSKFSFANRYAVGFDEIGATSSPWYTTKARTVNFPSMTDFFNNYAYSIARYAKHVDSSRITLVEQEWDASGSYTWHPPIASPNVQVILSGFSTYQNNLDATNDFYNAGQPYLGINTDKPYCDYTRLMKDGIRIYKNSFDFESYLNFTNVIAGTMLVQRITWTCIDTVIPLYQSARYNFYESYLPPYDYVGAYVPFIGEQTPNVTLQSTFNNWTSCYLYSDIVKYVRNQPQILFMQNNKNRTINFVPFDKTTSFSLYCNQTPQYIFLVFCN